jgi:hypothetical protein
VKNHSLKENDFLLFKYNGESFMEIVFVRRELLILVENVVMLKLNRGVTRQRTHTSAEC